MPATGRRVWLLVHQSSSGLAASLGRSAGPPLGARKERPMCVQGAGSAGMGATHVLPQDPEATGAPCRERVDPPCCPPPDFCIHGGVQPCPGPCLGPSWSRCSGLVRTAARGLLPCRPAERGPLRPSCATHSLAPASSLLSPSHAPGSLRLWAYSPPVYQPAHPRALARVCQRQGPFWCPAGAGSELGERLGRGNSLTRQRL